MVMGNRPDVETAGFFGASKASFGLSLKIVKGLSGVPFRQPWRGPSDPLANVTHELLRTTLKALFDYSAELPTPELRSLEIVIDEVSGATMPPPWRRIQVQIEDGEMGGISGQWIVPKTETPKGTILYLHGGGYMATTPKMYNAVVSRLAVVSNCRVFLPDYRLAPEFPFPAALIDAMHVYDALEAEVPVQEILVAGDSGGGGLSASLLVDLKKNMRPMPAGAILFSPEVDLTQSGASIKSNVNRDILPDQIPVEPYLHGVDPKDPLASPIFGDLDGYPPLLITSGGDERFRDGIRSFVDKARAADVKVRYYEAPDMLHVFEIVSPYSAETGLAFEDVHEFVREVLGKGPTSPA